MQIQIQIQTDTNTDTNTDTYTVKNTQIQKLNMKHEMVKNPIQLNFKSRALQPSEDEVSINRSPNSHAEPTFPLVFLEKLLRKIFGH